jgi:hypothetical protein
LDQPITLQYLGFETKGTVREYTFSLRGLGGASSLYLVTIPNDAFSEHRARYQDAPEICSLRLHRELSTHIDQPLSTTFSITDAELADYKDAHTPKAKPAYAKSRDHEDS